MALFSFSLFLYAQPEHDDSPLHFFCFQRYLFLAVIFKSICLSLPSQFLNFYFYFLIEGNMGSLYLGSVNLGGSYFVTFARRCASFEFLDCLYSNWIRFLKGFPMY